MAKKILVILNGAPYGDERLYNGLRLAGSLAKRPGTQLRVFLMGDAAGAAKPGQEVPSGFYNVERMLAAIAQRGGSIGACGSCLNARGMGKDRLAEGIRRGSLDELTDSTLWADQVIVF